MTIPIDTITKMAVRPKIQIDVRNTDINNELRILALRSGKSMRVYVLEAIANQAKVDNANELARMIRDELK